MPLTNIAVQKAKPQSKPTKLSDGGGLYLLVQPSGGKCWRYKYRFASKEKLLAFGTYPDVSLAEARERHAQARKVLAAGNDPGEVKKEAKKVAQLKSETTFEALARSWHENKKHSWTPKHAQQIMTRMEANLFPKIGNRPISNITASDLLSIARGIEERGAHDIAHRAMPDGLGWFNWFGNISLYVEVISWTKLLRDAEMRNKIFFNKLGID